VDDQWGVTFNVTYMYTANIGIELLAALPYEHDIAVGDLGTVASVKHLPPTLSLQYHFARAAPSSPTPAWASTTRCSSARSSRARWPGSATSMWTARPFGLAAQLGFDYMLNDRWFLNVDLRWIEIDTKPLWRWRRLVHGEGRDRPDGLRHPRGLSLLTEVRGRCPRVDHSCPGRLRPGPLQRAAPARLLRSRRPRRSIAGAQCSRLSILRQPVEDHDDSNAYNDKVVRQFAIMTIVWGVVGMLVGVIIAAQLACGRH
jgi:hypothetical protein